MSKKLLGVILAAATLAAPAAALACEGEGHEKHAKATVKTVTVSEVANLKKDGMATVLDANGESFRKNHGIIPGAVLLTHSRKYDVARELPAEKDRKLVFYCANTKCLASHAAARKALEAGYTDVNILPEGLLGWKEAGQPTAAFAPQS